MKPNHLLPLLTLWMLILPVQANELATVDFSVFNTRDLCVLMDEHSSNVIPVQKEMARRNLSLYENCAGIKAPQSYNHLNRAEYLAQAQFNRRLRQAEEYRVAEMPLMDSAELCSIYQHNTYAPSAALMTELSSRNLSPSQCEDIVRQELAEICQGFSVTNKEMTFSEIKRVEDRNAESSSALANYGKTQSYCEKNTQASVSTEVYNIDALRITTTSVLSQKCSSGAIQSLLIEGQIGPDSSFAVDRLMQRLPECRGADGEKLQPLTVSLASGGGFLNHGYLLGKTLRQSGAVSRVESGTMCASSCAVAFLGGTKRIVEEDAVIMYHAPYFTGENAYGKRDINCQVGQEALDELKEYYREMTDAETGDRLFERTMWYCSAEDGWVVKGGSAAELFGIATEK